MAPRKSKRSASKRPARLPRNAKFPPPPKVGAAFDKLVAVMSRLRSPNGCPWDREQTHATLRTYLIEEAYEVLGALDGANDAKFAEELGDLLLQVLFHAQIAREESRFSIADVIREIYEKMIRRHPHVFGEERAKDAAEVLRNWEMIKAEERRRQEPREEKGATATGSSKQAAISPASASPSASPSSSTSAPSILDGVPKTLPALLEALQLTRKAARIGFDWHNIDGIFAKLDEETGELRAALARSHESASPDTGTRERSFTPKSTRATASAPEELGRSTVESELGDILFVAVNLARFLNIDPEIALRKTSAKFSRRFREMERIARAQGTTLPRVPRPQMESLWEQAKVLEHANADAKAR
jgi:MazG family protein